MIEAEMIGYISSVGFPIAVATFLLLKLNNKIQEHTNILNAILIYLKTKKWGEPYDLWRIIIFIAESL